MEYLFKDVLEIKNGKNQKAVENPEGQYLIYGSGGLMGYADDYICEADTVIIGRKGNINNPIYVSEPFWNVDTAFGLLTNKKILLPRYLFYFCKKYDFEKLNKTVTIPSLTKSDLLKIKIKLPNIEEQQCVIDKLNKIESIIELRKHELKLLDDFTKARFVEMFGDLASSECMWEKKKLVDVCANKDDIKCGPFGTQLNKDEYMESGIAIWEIPQINTAFSSNPMHFLTREKAEQLKAYTIIPGDIAMSRKGNVGKCALFPVGYPEGIIHSDVLRIRVDCKSINPLFLMCQLHFSRSVTRQIELVSSGAIMAGVNVTKLKQIYIYVPPMELQQQFAAFVKATDKSKLPTSPQEESHVNKL